MSEEAQGFIDRLRANVATAEERVEHPSPPVTQVIEGWLPAKAKGIIDGLPKTYKSTISVELAVSLAYGVDFLGHFRVLQPPTNVLLIEEEVVDSELDAMLHGVMESRGIRAPDVWDSFTNEDTGGQDWFLVEQGHFVHPEEWIAHGWTPARVDTLVGLGMDLLDENKVADLEAFITEREIDYVVADPMYLMAGGKPLKEEESINRVLRVLNEMISRTGVTPILIHHSGWSAAREYGSVFLSAWKQFGWHIDMAEDTGVLTVKFTFRGLPRREPESIYPASPGVWERRGGSSKTDAMNDRREQWTEWVRDNTEGLSINAAAEKLISMPLYGQGKSTAKKDIEAIRMRLAQAG